MRWRNNIETESKAASKEEQGERREAVARNKKRGDGLATGSTATSTGEVTPAGSPKQSTSKQERRKKKKKERGTVSKCRSRTSSLEGAEGLSGGH